MTLTCRIVLLLTALAIAVPVLAQDEPPLIDLQGLEALRAVRDTTDEPSRPDHAELEAAYDLDQQAEAERREAESRIKALIGEQLSFQSELMDKSRTKLGAPAVLVDANPRVAPGSPSERELPMAIFDSEDVAIAPGVWGNGSRLQLVRLTLDADGNGKPELRRWIDRESKLQIRREEDRDYDGITDAWSEYEWGAIVSRVLDSNGDGNPDIWERYDKARMTSREIDRDDDGVRDAFYDYEDGSLIEERHDSNNDGRLDRVIRYQDRLRVNTEEDLDTDGRMDTWATYGNIAGKEVVTRIEHDKRGDGAVTMVEVFDTATGQAVIARRDEDVNGDGEVDVVSIYEKGKLVRREISDPALVEL